MSDAVAVGVTKSKRGISNFLRSLCSSLKCCFLFIILLFITFMTS